MFILIIINNTIIFIFFLVNLFFKILKFFFSNTKIRTYSNQVLNISKCYIWVKSNLISEEDFYIILIFKNFENKEPIFLINIIITSG